VQLRAAAARLQLENQKIKDEMSQIINEVVNTYSMFNQTPRPEWCTALRSDVERQHLQSSYKELYNLHIANPREITPDIHAKMTEGYALLHTSYINLVKDHAALKDDLERLTRQLANPTNVRDQIVDHFPVS
jgi:hypothetical protein